MNQGLLQTHEQRFDAGSFRTNSTVEVPVRSSTPRNNDHVCTLFATTSYAISTLETALTLNTRLLSEVTRTLWHWNLGIGRQTDPIPKFQSLQ